MNCRATVRRLPGYLDGAVGGRESDRVRGHLESCHDCRRELERYREMSICLGHLDSVSPPADLAERIREQASLERARQERGRAFWGRALLVFDNILRPLAVPATGGVATAVLTFLIVVQNLFVGIPLGAVPNDLPTNLLQPARLESLAPFGVPGIAAGNGAEVLVIAATLDARGDVVNYEILAGPDDRAVRHQLDQILLFSRFRPQLSFGRPTAGGRVIMSFSEIRVKG
jgi:anti-sigma factor RsiW